MSFSEFISPFVGRLMLAWFFLNEAFGYVGNFDPTVQLMTFKHVPAAAAVLAFGLLILGLGSLSLALGYLTRYGAMLLFGYMIVVAATMHDYWTIQRLSERMAEFDVFTRDIAVAGGLLVLVGVGPGGLALDNRAEKD